MESKIPLFSDLYRYLNYEDGSDEIVKLINISISDLLIWLNRVNLTEKTLKEREDKGMKLVLLISKSHKACMATQKQRDI